MNRTLQITKMSISLCLGFHGEIFSDHQASSLVIDAVTLQDSGSYVCRAGNSSDPNINKEEEIMVTVLREWEERGEERGKGEREGGWAVCTINAS